MVVAVDVGAVVLCRRVVGVAVFVVALCVFVVVVDGVDDKVLCVVVVVLLYCW